MYKINLLEIKDIFNTINSDCIDNTLIEISIKKSRINYEFLDANLLHIQGINGLLEDELITESMLYLTSLNDNIRVTFDCEDIVLHNMVPDNSIYKPLLNLLEEIGEHICQCPALEYAISEDYVKVYIDKPNIAIEDLQNLSEVFDSSFSLELQKQRPYCLFIYPKEEQKSIEVNTTLVPPSVLTSDMVRKI